MGKSLLYANGVASAMSNKLISKDTFNRMVDAKTNVEALAILQETNFASGLSIDSPFDFEDLTNYETKKFINFVKNESPEEELTSFFLLPYDYNNIAGVCKSIMLNQNELDFVEAEGYYELSNIKDIITSKNFNRFNNKFIEKCLTEFQDLASKKSINGYEVDLIFKTYLFKNLKGIAKNPLVKEIIKMQIDIENISVAMRCENSFMVEQQILKDGQLSLEQLLKIFRKDKSVLSDVKNEIIKKFIELALSENKSEAFVEFEILKNKFVFSICMPEKYDNNKLTPFALYCFEREVQIKNVRLIMSYKNNNISGDIKKRMLEW